MALDSIPKPLLIFVGLDFRYDVSENDSLAHLVDASRCQMARKLPQLPQSHQKLVTTDKWFYKGVHQNCIQESVKQNPHSPSKKHGIFHLKGFVAKKLLKRLKLFEPMPSERPK
jgi:hypothetical protein